MKRRKKKPAKQKKGLRENNRRAARGKLTESQHEEQPQPNSDGVGPLQVGKGTEPGDLDVHYEFVKNKNGSKRALGIRVRLSKAAIALLIIGGVLACGLIAHDRVLVEDGLAAIKAISTPIVQMRDEVWRYAKGRHLKAK